MIARHLPDGAIVSDEAVTSGNAIREAMAGAPRHDWLGTTGGAIGMGLPLAIGASIAGHGRPVLALEADGSSMYTVQALWTMARENLNITTVILANGRYAILAGELSRVGATPGRSIDAMLSLERPRIDFVALASGMGVDGARVTTAAGLEAALGRGLDADGPFLIEATI